MLELKKIVKDYVSGTSTVKALKGVDITFRESEFVSILGPSGCGKTTTLRMIAGLEDITDGTVIIDGFDVSSKKTDLNKVRENVGMVFYLRKI